MIDVNTIKNVLKSKSRGPHTRLEDVVAYEGKYGIGVRIPVKIEDVSGSSRVERVVLFDTLREVEEFVELYDYSTEVVADGQYGPVIAPIFYREGKRISLEDTKTRISGLDKDAKKKIEVYKKLKDYLSERRAKFDGSLDMVNAQKSENISLKKKLDELIDQALKGKIKEDDDIDYPEYKSTREIEDFEYEGDISKILYEAEKEVKNLAIINDYYQRKEVCDNLIKVEILLRDKKMLEEEIEFIKGLTPKGFLGRKTIKKDEIDEGLEEIKAKYPVINISDIKFNQEDAELKMEQLLVKLPVEERLEAITEFDSLSYLENRKKYVEKLEEKYIDRQALNIEEDEAWQEEVFKKTISYKKKEIEKSLRRQFIDNLTKEQQEALMIYQTSLYLPMTAIAMIPNYKSLSEKDIIDELRKANGFEYIQRSVKNLSHYAKTSTAKFAQVLKKVVPAKTDADFIQGLIKQIKIIESIPPEAIVLEENVAVYREITPNDDFDWEKPPKGLLLSTSLDIGNARKNGSEEICKFYLRQGTPVLYIPYRIKYVEGAENPNYEVFDEGESEIKNHELIINMRFMKPPINKLIHEVKDIKFDKNKGDFIDKKEYSLIEADILVKDDVARRIEKYS